MKIEFEKKINDLQFKKIDEEHEAECKDDHTLEEHRNEK